MGSRYVGYYTKSTNNKSKNRQVGLHQTGKLCTAKEIINRVKRQPTEQEKIFANHISDKGLVYKIHRSCYKAIAKNQRTWFLAGERTWKGISTQKTYKWSISIIIMEMQIKTIVQYHIILLRMAIIKKKKKDDKHWQESRENGTLLYC